MPSLSRGQPGGLSNESMRKAGRMRTSTAAAAAATYSHPRGTTNTSLLQKVYVGRAPLIEALSDVCLSQQGPRAPTMGIHTPPKRVPRYGVRKMLPAMVNIKDCAALTARKSPIQRRSRCIPVVAAVPKCRSLDKRPPTPAQRHKNLLASDNTGGQRIASCHPYF